MICDSYDQLTSIEKTKMIGSVVHALMNDDGCFQLAEELIRIAERKGLFDTVTILPEGDNIRNESL